MAPSADPVAGLVRALVADRRWGPNVVASEELPAVAARWGPWPAGLHGGLRAAAEARGLARLYSHQARAVQAALTGQDVAVVSGTASGKSLCYVLPILDALLRAPETTALLLFPTKALAHDQLARLEDWAAALPAGLLRPAAYDGDTPRHRRSGTRAAANVLVTNPDMLHTAILPYHGHWARFLAALRYVVLDEMHVYRGVFGSHVANLLRRLRRLARFHGAAPRFLLTSATVANPAELGRLLLGTEPLVVDDDGAPRGPRTLIFYNPPLVDEALNLRRSSLLEAESLARHFLAGGVQTIVFARSRQAAELMVRYLRNVAGTVPDGGVSAGDPDPGPGGPEGPIVRGYRGGYLAGERRAIEAALRRGELRGVVATTALELGIDVGDLDACVMAGYPGTIASTWQQAGRAGRRLGRAVAVLVAGSTPLDQYVVGHPEHVLGQSPEHARLDPDNLLILLDHVRCAAFELPFQAEEAARPFGADGADGAVGTTGPPVADLLAVLTVQGYLRQVGGTWYWLADAFPAATVGLRTTGPGDVVIVLAGDGGGGVTDVLGTVSRQLAPLTVHPGAIYLHDGATYRVTELDWEAGRALVQSSDGAEYTRASGRVDLRPTRVLAEGRAGGARLGHGALEIRAKATGYRRLRFRTHETLGWGIIDLPEQVLEAGGYWFVVDEAVVADLRGAGHWDYEPGGDRGPDWHEQRGLALARDGQRCQVCGQAGAPGRPLQVHHLRPYRSFRGPAGAVGPAANHLDNLVTLCAVCHRAAENALGLHGALQGLGYALVNIAPLFLMCDPRDLGVTTTVHSLWAGGPTVTLFERVAAGVGFAETLFHLHERLLAAAAALVSDCPCRQGCPACVGPTAEGVDAKGHVLAVLAALADLGPEPESATSREARPESLPSVQPKEGPDRC